MGRALTDMFPREDGSQASLPATGTEELGSSPTESRIMIQRITQQLVELEREEPTESINRKRLELKRLRNNALLVHRLLDELLTQIFGYFQDSVEAWNPKVSSRHSTRAKGARPVEVWHDLMLVCSHWRNLLVSTPAFWRIVDTKQRVEWMRLCLARSAGASLDVRTTVQDKYTLDLLYPQVHRFRKLLLSAGPSKSRVQAALPPLLGGSMPVLEHLEFSISQVGQQRSNVDFGPYLTSDRFPSLRTLDLERVISPTDKPLYAQLRTLSLSRCTHSVSFDGFLDALAACAQLEELRLKNTLHSLSGDWMAEREAIPDGREPITLPSLRVLSLDEDASSIIPLFLAHLHIPVSTSLRLTSDFHLDIDGGGLFDPAGNTLSALLPPTRAATLPILATTTRLSTTFMPGQWDTWAAHGQSYRSDILRTLEDEESELESEEEEEWTDNITATPPPPQEECPFPAILTLYSKSRMGLADDPWMGRALRDLVTCFGRSPLTALAVNEHTTESCTSVAGWEGVFRTFALLEDLTLSAPRVELATVFLGLHAASARASEGEGSPPPAVACPRLARVSVEGWGTVATYAAMRRCFRRRAERGVRLEELDLRSLFDGEGMTEEKHRVFVGDLRRVVGYVEDN